MQTVSPGHTRLIYLDMMELTAEPEETASILKDYVAAHNLAGTPAAVAFQDESLHIRRMDLPKMPEEDLKEAVRWQLRDVAEGSMDDYVIQYSILEEVPSVDMVKLNMLGFAIKKNLIHSQVQILEKAGMKPFFMQPTPVSLATMVEKTYPSMDKEWVACIDIGFKRSNFLALEGRKLHFVRPLAGVSLAQAVELKTEYPTKLALEIQHAIDAFSITYHVEKVEKIFLAGGGAGIENLSVYLSQNLGIVTEILNPFLGLEQVSQFPLAAQKPYLFGPAIGLAYLRP